MREFLRHSPRSGPPGPPPSAHPGTAPATSTVRADGGRDVYLRDTVSGKGVTPSARSAGEERRREGGRKEKKEQGGESGRSLRVSNRDPSPICPQRLPSTADSSPQESSPTSARDRLCWKRLVREEGNRRKRYTSPETGVGVTCDVGFHPTSGRRVPPRSTRGTPCRTEQGRRLQHGVRTTCVCGGR